MSSAPEHSTAHDSESEEQALIEEIWILAKTDPHAACIIAAEKLRSEPPLSTACRQEIAVIILSLVNSQLRLSLPGSTNDPAKNSIPEYFDHVLNELPLAEDDQDAGQKIIGYPDAHIDTALETLLLAQYCRKVLESNDQKLSRLIGNLSIFLASHLDQQGYFLLQIGSHEASDYQIKTAFDQFMDSHSDYEPRMVLRACALYCSRVSEKCKVREMVKAYNLAKQTPGFNERNFWETVSLHFISRRFEVIIIKLRIMLSFLGKDQGLEKLINAIENYSLIVGPEESSPLWGSDE